MLKVCEEIPNMCFKLKKKKTKQSKTYEDDESEKY